MDDIFICRDSEHWESIVVKFVARRGREIFLAIVSDPIAEHINLVPLFECNGGVGVLSRTDRRDEALGDVSEGLSIEVRVGVEHRGGAVGRNRSGGGGRLVGHVEGVAGHGLRFVVVPTVALFAEEPMLEGVDVCGMRSLSRAKLVELMRGVGPKA